ncbi:MAG: hypothetical protein K0R29_2011, partial [Pseudobdellovibrio sp.]|nr:hypothetical protein [Pseudobdellovibrio sp.]
ASSQNAPLKLSRSGEYYVIEQPPEWEQAPPQVIEVRTRMNNSKKAESFKFNLQRP